MNDTTNPARRLRHGDRPTTPLRWGERWTLLLTGPHHGMIGPYGSTWPNQSAEYERVNVIAETADQTAEADVEPIAWMKPDEIQGLKEKAGKQSEERFYGRIYANKYQDDMVPVCQVPRVLVPKLESIEQYRLQMAAIGTASFGYWKEGDTIHPDYDTVPLRDVARLYAKYEALFNAQPSAAARDVLAERRRQVEQEGYDAEHDDAHPGGEIAAYAAFYAMPPAARDWPATETGYGTTFGEAIVPADWKVPKEGDRRAELVKAGALILAEIERIDRATKQAALQELADQAQELNMGYGAPAQPAAPDAVEAALTDAIVHGTGAFRVHGDGSTEHVDLRQAADMVRPDVTAADFTPPGTVLSEEDRRYYAELAAFPPKLQRDALYQDYAVPKTDGGEK